MNGDINAVFQIAGVGILLAIIHTVLKQAGKEDFAHWATLTGFIVILFIVISYLSRLFTEIRDVFLIQ